MNRDQLEGNWKQLKGTLKEKFGQLTDDDLTVIEGQADQLQGRLQERYGYAREEAETKARDFWDSVHNKSYTGAGTTTRP